VPDPTKLLLQACTLIYGLISEAQQALVLLTANRACCGDPAEA
jgi:hypothetical protein